ncbi:hypothetical protein HJP15_12265 [Pseudoalteromonas sp. NEC-BIFX-2020_002]|uniref:hypothetical protein n=1 Tax=Pseudoalteromonas sp. NEC-BIFX-2020_002 TaxID=2732353 RepID=UPI0014770F02|nr:hypothetical protein [Pseudoalteromonas sp. NEC-BIFX-2020_002]NNG43683.1 hypothetical protein [Pseudoalteromonas sp. NEC-BIFX-2020_002]
MEDSLSKLITNNVENMPPFAEGGNYTLKNTGYWPQKTSGQWTMFYLVNLIVSVLLGLLGIDFFPQPTHQAFHLQTQVLVSAPINMVLISGFRLALWVHDNKRKAQPIEVNKTSGCITPVSGIKPIKATVKVFPKSQVEQGKFHIFTGLQVEYDDNTKQQFNRLSVLQLPELVVWLESTKGVEVTFKTSLIKKVPVWFANTLLLIVATVMAIRLYQLFLT